MKKKKELNKNTINVTINRASIVDDGEGKISFKKPQVITDNSEQFNGTKYDIPSMDISGYDGMLTANHSMHIQEIVGKTFGIKKDRNKVTIDGVNFAIKENPLARYAYNMMLGGFLTDFSIETVGPWPNDDGVYLNSELIGLSIVVKGNNKSATVNKIALNSIQESKNDGLDTTEIEKELGIDNNKILSDNEINMKYKAVKNSREFSVSVSFKNSEGEDTTVELKPGQSVDVELNQAEAVETQISDAQAPAPEDKNEDKIADAVNSAVKPLMDKIEKMENVFDKNASVPTFTNSKATEIKDMNYKERHAKQINLAWDFLKGGNAEAGKQLQEINKVNMEQLIEKDIVPNSVTLADFGNFVMSPELLTEIQGFRSDFAPLLSKLDYRETLSLQMAWLNRSGDISMSEVETCDDGANGNLKPISDYGATIETSNLHELAAVTPVCNAATRFLAVDLLGDVAAGYRNDYDRKRAQLFIARLQQAVDITGNVAIYNTTTDVNALKSWVDMVAEISEEIVNGVFILSNASRWEMIKTAIGSGINGNILGILQSGDLTPLLGAPSIIVPNELLPKLNTAETKTFVVEGSNVTINHAIFYTDLSTFTGRTSGGLNFDLSTEAAYEENSVVKSAFQRNELVLRGSFFRGGAVKDTAKVSALGTRGVS